MKYKTKYTLLLLLIIFGFLSILISLNSQKIIKFQKYVPDIVLNIARDYIFYIPQTIRRRNFLEIENKNLQKINNNNLVSFPYMVGEKIIPKSLNFTKHNINIEFNKILVPYQTPNQNLSKKTFYVHETNENIFLFYQSGKIQFLSKKNLLNKEKVIFSKVKNNLYNDIINDNEMFYGVKNILEIDGFIYLSYTKVVNNCYSVDILKAKISKKKMLFEPFFETGDCVQRPPKKFGLYSQGGKMIKYKNNKILMTIGELGQGITLNLSQDDKRIWGKVISIDLDTKKFEIFSKGHRNPQGLYWDEDKDLILETEHGPIGGDEVNLLKFGKNYGSPIAHYGEVSGKSADKTHEELGFVEPITYFTPAIAPSGIIKAHNTNNLNLDNYYFITSLRGQALYLIKFKSDYQKVELIDYIDLNERIRHMIYLEKENIYLLALENSPSLGILRIKD